MTSAAPLDDTANSRARLAGHAYASDRELAARQNLYHWQTPRYDLPRLIAAEIAGLEGVLLDVGCGNGKTLTQLRKLRPDLTIIGLDLSPGILAGLDPPLVVADAAQLPFATGTIDGVLAMHMIYHLPDITAGLRELARVLLRPGGLLVASTNAHDDKAELDQLWSRAAADVLGIAEGPHRVSLSSRFPLDDAPTLLRQHFSDVKVIELPGTIAVTEPGPVVAHLASYRAWADQTGVPFAATIERARQLVDAHIGRNGNYTITCRGGILVAAQH